MPNKAETFYQLRKKKRPDMFKVKDPRPSACKRGYGRPWQRVSKAHLKRYPLCAICLREGRTTSATLVDHIVPHKGDMKVFWNQKNWQSSCTPCHNIKTAKEDGGFGNK